MINSNLVKPEKSGHLHLVYHFKIPLSQIDEKKRELFTRKWKIIQLNL